MDGMKQFWILARKEFVLEWRSKFALGGILLYVVSTVFIVYTGFIDIGERSWNVLFWIIVLFTSVNAVAKSFTGESSDRRLYYYTLVNPSFVIFSKILYNTFLLVLLNLLTYVILSIVAGSPVRDMGLFLIAILLGSVGMSAVFTLVAAIASQARNSATLMAILGFPLLIPILLTLIKISAGALGILRDTAVDRDIWTLVAVDLIVLGLAYVLFPYLWKD